MKKVSIKKASPYFSNSELESIIERFADAMRAAHLPYIANSPIPTGLTGHMDEVWSQYIDFAQAHSIAATVTTTRTVYR